jgi:hypothetical protein
MPRLGLAAILFAAALGSAFAQDKEERPRTVQEVDQQDLEELEAARKRVADQYQQLNAMNPLSTSGPSLSDLDPAKLPPQLKWVGEILAKPELQEGRKRLLQVVSDPTIQKSAGDIYTNPNLKWLGGALLAFVIFYVIIKSRILAVTDRWWVKLLLRLSLICCFYLGAFLIGYGFLGQSLVHVLWGMKRIVIG